MKNHILYIYVQLQSLRCFTHLHAHIYGSCLKYVIYVTARAYLGSSETGKWSHAQWLQMWAIAFANVMPFYQEVPWTTLISSNPFPNKCKLLLPICKTWLKFLRKLKLDLHHVLAISRLEYILKRNEMDKEMRLIYKAVSQTSMFTTTKYFWVYLWVE